MLRSIQLNVASGDPSGLTARIQEIGQTDPKLASQLSLSLLKHKSALFNHSKNETAALLRSHNLPLSITKPTLLGGGDEGGGGGGGDEEPGLLSMAKKKIIDQLVGKGVDFASGLIVDAVQSDWKGNFEAVKNLCAKPGQPIPASIKVQGHKVNGIFKGELTKVKMGGCCIPSFGVEANGLGEFIGKHDDVGKVVYKGNFSEFKFDDNTGKAEYQVEDILYYTGGFKKGKRSGVAKVQRMDVEAEKFFQYFEGEYLDDEMFNGVVCDVKGEEVCYIKNASVGPAMGDKPVMSGGKVKKGAVVPY